MIGNFRKRYELLSKYVEGRRSLEETMTKAKDPIIRAAYLIRRPVTTGIALWKELVTKNRLRIRQLLGLE